MIVVNLSKDVLVVARVDYSINKITLPVKIVSRLRLGDIQDLDLISMILDIEEVAGTRFPVTR